MTAGFGLHEAPHMDDISENDIEHGSSQLLGVLDSLSSVILLGRAVAASLCRTIHIVFLFSSVLPSGSTRLLAARRIVAVAQTESRVPSLQEAHRDALLAVALQQVVGVLERRGGKER